MARLERLRMAGALNQQGRLLYFYGLGITIASNNNDHVSRHNEHARASDRSLLI